MNEFKIIPQAPDYKINKEGEVIRSSNGRPLLSLSGGKVLLKKLDGTMQSFMTADLVNELFGNEDTKGQLRSQVVDFVENNKILIQSETDPDGSITRPITYVKPTAEEQKELEKEEINTNESEDANLVKDDEKPKAKRNKFEWVFNGTGAGKSPEHPESKVPKKKEKVKKSIQKEVGVTPDGISGPVTKEVLTKEIKRIISLDCSESMKIWKLSQVGCSNEEILTHLKLPKEKSKKCLNTIWNYKNNPSMRKKADLK